MVSFVYMFLTGIINPYNNNPKFSRYKQVFMQFLLSWMETSRIEVETENVKWKETLDQKLLDI